jgi:3-dehydroquinate dehydratase / shikimate dehydrogenase
MTLVCVPITVRDPESALADAVAAKSAGAEIVEFRVDDFFTGDPTETEWQTRQIAGLVSDAPLPCIVTCRAAAEGGGYSGDPEARAALYAHLASLEAPVGHPPRYIDVELASIQKEESMRAWVESQPRTSLIVSMHDFDSRPADFSRRVLNLQSQPRAAVAKIAYRARSLRDSLELLDLARDASGPTIALGMGEFGLMSRVLAPKFGGFLTFASLRPQAATAPGQPTIAELLSMYRFRSIGRATRVFGVVGWPVGHSMSPLIHNAGFDALGFDGVYLPLPIAAEPTDAEGSYASFKGTLLELIHHPRLDFAGCSVTIPHKENLVRLAREQRWGLDALSDAVGAANTLFVSRNASGSMDSCRVLNTDGPAAAQSLREVVGELADQDIAIFGAGGVAAGIAAALMQDSAKVIVCNRSDARATALVDRLNAARSAFPRATTPARAIPFDQRASLRIRALVNGTPVGMAGGPDPTSSSAPLMDLAPLNSDLVVMDTVYNPIQTPLLTQARAMGLRTIDGVRMFVLQAQAQFEAWTSRPAPIELFDELVRRRLDPGSREGAP